MPVKAWLVAIHIWSILAKRWSIPVPQTLGGPWSTFGPSCRRLAESGPWSNRSLRSARRTGALAQVIHRRKVELPGEVIATPIADWRTLSKAPQVCPEVGRHSLAYLSSLPPDFVMPTALERLEMAEREREPSSPKVAEQLSVPRPEELPLAIVASSEVSPESPSSCRDVIERSLRKPKQAVVVDPWGASASGPGVRRMGCTRRVAEEPCLPLDARLSPSVAFWRPPS